MVSVTGLRQSLNSLCNNSHWNYAVFWKLDHHSRTILTWEDGYCENSIPRHSVESMTDETYLDGTNMKFSSEFETSIHSGNSGGYQIDLVAEMSRIQYTLGEGSVGRVAITGNHSWIFLDDIFTSNVNSNATIQSLDEWLLQLASGIKTLLLVPVLPHGVLQLGSFEMVNEDLAMVAYIKERFDAFHHVSRNTVPFTSSKGVSAHSKSSDLLDNLDKSLACDDSKPNLTSNNLRISSMGETFLACDDCDVLFEENFNGLHSYSSGFMKEQHFRDYNANDIGFRSVDDLFMFPQDCELHKALGPAFQRKPDDIFLDSSFSVRNTSSNLVHNSDLADGIESSWVNREDDPEYRLEDIVADLYSNLDKRSSNKSTNPSSGRVFDSSELHSLPEVSNLTVEDILAPLSHAKSSALARNEDSLTNFSKSATLTNSSNSTPLISMLSTLIVNEEEKEFGKKRPRNAMNPSKLGRRKANHSDQQRPRPRDRQLIQDRVKVLRELVPNGAKCSIDGLLDRTIKHMLYLRSVTDQAEKLKQLGCKEASERKNCGSFETKGGFQNGTSWAFDFRSDLQVCPIVVEDLECPGHMLIEMLCNDQGMFLEIAQVIRRLDLTILKGVMEWGTSNTWAHFVVEASRGFHRMDIFWPLMHLLQRKRKIPSHTRSEVS